MPRDHINRPATEAFMRGWDEMHTDASDLTMARYLELARPDESYLEWRSRMANERQPAPEVSRG
jgi:hypothetical protein